MNDEDKLQKLTRWAIAAHCVEGGPAPFGFATRVAARWAAGKPPTVAGIWEWFSLRSVAIALGIMLLTIFVNHDLLSDGFTPEVSVADSIAGPLL